MPSFLRTYFPLWLLVSAAGCLPGLGPVANAQSIPALIKAGDRSLAEADYYAALHHYEQALARRPDPQVWLRAGHAARQFNAPEVAAGYYRQYLESSGGSQDPTAWFWLAKCQQSLANYTEAAASLQQYDEYAPAGHPLRPQANLLLASIELAREEDGFTGPKARLERLGRQVNSPYSDFGAWATSDSLFFSSYRFEYPKDNHRPPRQLTRVLLAKGEGRARPLAKGYQVDTLHTAHTAINPQGSRMYFTLCRFEQGARINCQLAYRERDRRGRWRTEYTLLPAPINLPGFTTTQPTVAYDSIWRTHWLYFVSDRPGGSGGLDLWRAPIPAKTSDPWVAPLPLTPLNTPWDDLTPFFHQASQTLYFSSDGYPGLGGYDVFSTSLQTDTTWLTPINLGRDINSSYHDLYYFLRPDRPTGYLSSNRPGAAYLDDKLRSCCLDIFAVDILPPTPPPVDSLSLAITPLPSPEPSLASPPRELSSYRNLSEFLPLALYFDNDEPDRRTRRTTTRQDYATTYSRYYPRKEEYLDRYQAGQTDDNREAAEALLDAFFEEQVRAGYEKLNRFAEILLTQLQAGQAVEIFLKGFTSPRAQSDYNLSLGQRRVHSVRLFFEQWQNGIFQPYLLNKQLVVTEVSFGETRAAGNVSDDLFDEAASIYSPGAAAERRVEIVDIKED